LGRGRRLGGKQRRPFEFKNTKNGKAAAAAAAAAASKKVVAWCEYVYLWA
jgi:hypothetical protein